MFLHLMTLPSNAVLRTKAALSRHGFGVLTEIDLKATMKKIDVDDYLILGSCNPHMAYEAMTLEPKVGAMLPCNVIVRSLGAGDVMVSAVDPVESMRAIDNDSLAKLAESVRSKLSEVIAEV